jgi:hypothetical protein
MMRAGDARRMLRVRVPNLPVAMHPRQVLAGQP